METNHFNNLTEAEQERLVKLQEECAELIAIISKTLLHGYESFNPDPDKDNTINRDLIAIECGDVAAEIERLIQYNDITQSIVRNRREFRIVHPKYFHH